MASRQGRVSSEPIKMYEPTPKAAASNIVFLVAWLAGTTCYFLVRESLSATIGVMC